MKTFNLQFVFFVSLALSFGLSPLFAKLAFRLHLVDSPGHRKIHKTPISYLGGAAILLSVILTFLLAYLFFGNQVQDFTTKGLMKSAFILGCSLGVGFVGLMDDAFTLSARYKLMGQFIFALGFAFFGFQFQTLHLPGLHPASLGLMSIPLTVFWILAVVNAFNMIDGLDGLAAIVSISTLLLLATATTLTENNMELLLALSALGAVLGFLPYNWKPAKLYLGDAGSGGLGMLIACALVALGQNYGDPPLPQNHMNGQPFYYQIVIVTLMVAYPAMEIILSVTRRLLRGRPVWRADKGHIHHRLLHTGWKVQGICIAAFGFTLLSGLAAISTFVGYHGWAAFLLVICSLIIGLGLSTLGFLDFFAPHVIDQLRPHYQIAHHFISMQKVKLSLAHSREEVLTLVDQACHELGVRGYRLIIRSDEKLRGGLDYAQGLDPTRLTDLEKPLGPIDHVRLSGGKGGAEWMFEPQAVEGELDVEYRVLVSEFMRAALVKASHLGKNKETLEISNVGAFSKHQLSGHHLRKRGSTKITDEKIARLN